MVLFRNHRLDHQYSPPPPNELKANGSRHCRHSLDPKICERVCFLTSIVSNMLVGRFKFNSRSLLTESVCRGF